MHDYAPSGPTIIPLIDMPLVAQNIRAIDLLTMLVDGGVDDAPLNNINVGCRRWCYWALRRMEEEGVISGDWRTSVDEYVEQVRVAGAALGTHVMDEMVDDV